MDNKSLCKEPVTKIFYATPNTPKSSTMQVMWVRVLKNPIIVYEIINGKLTNINK